MAGLIFRVQVILVVCVGQEIREIRHKGLHHPVGIQPGFVPLLGVLGKETVPGNHFPDFRKQVLACAAVIHMGKPSVVVQSEVYRVQVFPAAV